MQLRAKAVLFDMDGVLLDTEPLYTQATQAVVAPYGKVFDWSVKGEIIGRNSVEGAEYTIRALGLPLSPEEYLKRRAAYLDPLFDDVPAMAGAERLVTRLHEAGVAIAVATSSAAGLFRQKTRGHAWFRYFGSVVCGDDPELLRSKPAPDIFLLAARRLGVEAADCTVVEDSLAGVEAALAAGMRVIAVPHPALDRERYAAAHHVLSSLEEIESPETSA